MASSNESTSVDLGKPQFASHSWVEPIIVVSIMLSSLYFNRRRDFSIFGKNNNRDLGSSHPLYMKDEEANDSIDNLSEGEINGQFQSGPGVGNNYPPKRRNCLWFTVKTPNSSRFARHFHSRILQKFPFLVEMFYWVMNYLFYSCTKAVAQSLSPAGRDVVQLAQDHAIGVLNLEHNSFLSIFFPIEEADFQAFFINGHPNWMTFFNRIYSLVHIPGTVAYLSWWYYAAPDFDRYAIARRTMTLGNFMAFIIFCFWPLMPPRLLPESFGFHDTVRQEHAESVWVGGKMVNQLAAMPSLHFTYAFCIGNTFFYHSGVFHRLFGKRSARITLRDIFLVILGVVYPMLVLSVIVATANHYWLDAVVATFSVVFSFFCNRIWMILLPLEDMLLWVLRLEKPIPTTGSRRRGGPTDDENDRDGIEYRPL
ncbi:phosphatase PAP2 family protein [Aspergillus fijiensis CBS 313.89]|uniref:Inositolphosphotransferase Aur1/Ipt1 domain-containing protein n=1 Tax=Aspergillus fijiensis CBS 313.89 TaxID=1448319 RepID=A0A8G1RLY7_9EURO|nr:uncharacterized protein BO72DRAFT_459454 [Aspergillus fijiensis CBS 313.89]RAK76477.1 hypothetical protein BO72DRAFT_459454 [Aspergillus fijiensis CBS 313.89]